MLKKAKELVETSILNVPQVNILSQFVRDNFSKEGHEGTVTLTRYNNRASGRPHCNTQHRKATVKLSKVEHVKGTANVIGTF